MLVAVERKRNQWDIMGHDVLCVSKSIHCHLKGFTTGMDTASGWPGFGPFSHQFIQILSSHLLGLCSPFPILLCSSHTCLQRFDLMSLHLECPWQLLPILQSSAPLTPPPRSFLFCQVSGAGLPAEQLGLGREGTGRIPFPGNPGQPISQTLGRVA